VINDCFEAEPDCVAACIDHHAGLDADCLGVELELTQCLAGLTCDELNQFAAQDPEPYPCQAEQEASCLGGGGGECIVGVGAGENPGECSVSVQCEGDPEQSVECNGALCTCYIDNVEVGGCANAVEICNDPGSETLAACCGF
jgi:hypothetical protein